MGSMSRSGALLMTTVSSPYNVTLFHQARITQMSDAPLEMCGTFSREALTIILASFYKVVLRVGRVADFLTLTGPYDGVTMRC